MADALHAVPSTHTFLQTSTAAFLLGIILPPDMFSSVFEQTLLVCMQMVSVGLHASFVVGGILHVAGGSM